MRVKLQGWLLQTHSNLRADISIIHSTFAFIHYTLLHPLAFYWLSPWEGKERKKYTNEWMSVVLIWQYTWKKICLTATWYEWQVTYSLHLCMCTDCLSHPKDTQPTATTEIDVTKCMCPSRRKSTVNHRANHSRRRWCSVTGTFPEPAATLHLKGCAAAAV